MARGRMLNKSVSLSEFLASLRTDGMRIFLTWAISHADRDGRIPGNAAKARALIIPMLDHISTAEVEEAFVAAEAGDEPMLRRYRDHNGQHVAVFINFPRQQPGLRREREGRSLFGPPPWELQEFDGETPDPEPHDHTRSGVPPDEVRRDSSPNKNKNRKENKKGVAPTGTSPPKAPGPPPVGSRRGTHASPEGTGPVLSAADVVREELTALVAAGEVDPRVPAIAECILAQERLAPIHYDFQKTAEWFVDRGASADAVCATIRERIIELGAGSTEPQIRSRLKWWRDDLSKKREAPTAESGPSYADFEHEPDPTPEELAANAQHGAQLRAAIGGRT